MNVLAVQKIANRYRNWAKTDLTAYRLFCKELNVLYERFVIGKISVELTSEDFALNYRAGRYSTLYIQRDQSLSTFNPLSEKTAYSSGHEYLTYNHLARALHDILGHLPERFPLTFEGEVMAHMAERTYFSPVVQPVLFADNIGQLCLKFHTGEHPAIQHPYVMEPSPLGDLL